jgi:UDP-2-acetamido-3-amino-2,3-dideoxy-glucuronate N-acetyltransferase
MAVNSLNREYFLHESSFADAGCVVGKNTKIWHFTHIMSGAVVGENCNIGQNVFIASGVHIGNGVKIQNNVSLYEGVAIEDNVFLGPSCVFTNVINPRAAVERKSEYKNTLIREGASIGANATVVCGVTIGKFAFVGAGAVVTKDISDYELVVGNPSKHIGWLSEHGEKLQFDHNGLAICRATDAMYQLENNKVRKL